MDKRENLYSRLFVNGYALNPITSPNAMIALMRGLAGYPPEHNCDFNDIGGCMHKNYIGTMVDSPIIRRIEEKGNEGLIGFGTLTNGYFTLRFWDKIYPAEVQLDLYVRTELKDADLIIDHLRAPAMPYDGIGLFDYTYSLTHTPILFSPLTKKDPQKAAYTVNPTVNYLAGGDDGKWEMVLNELETISCYWCDSNATFWVISGPPWERLQNGEVRDPSLLTMKTVPACEAHRQNGRYRELGDNRSLEKDFRTGGPSIRNISISRGGTEPDPV